MMRLVVVMVMVVASCSSAPSSPAADLAMAPADLAEPADLAPALELCPVPGFPGWQCASGTRTCYPPDGGAVTIAWPYPIYCTDAGPVSPRPVDAGGDQGT